MGLLYVKAEEDGCRCARLPGNAKAARQLSLSQHRQHAVRPVILGMCLRQLGQLTTW